jgi:hypothetical protein
MRVTTAVDLVTLAAIKPTVSGQQVSVPVADDPVEVLVDPTDADKAQR